jgi:hypothetical protein
MVFKIFQEFPEREAAKVLDIEPGTRCPINLAFNNYKILTISEEGGAKDTIIR